MPRSKKKLDEFDTNSEEEKVVEEVWDGKKIIVGVGLILVVVVISTLIFLYFGSVSQKQEARIRSDTSLPTIPPPSIKPITTQDVTGAVDDLKKNLPVISFENLISSQSAVVQMISNIEKAKSISNSAKDIICSVLCK